MEIRTISADETVAFRRTVRAGFGISTVDDADFATATTGDVTRARVAIDGATMAGTLRSFATELTVPGSAVTPASALTAVTVAPTHRRRGVLREMITSDLAESRDRGEPVSVLIASEYPIYGRFGYGLGAWHTSWELDLAHTRFASPSQGTVELVDRATLRAEAPAVFERVRAARPGMIVRDPLRFDIQLGTKRQPEDKPAEGYCALCRDGDGVVQGYLEYEWKESWLDRRARNRVEVVELLGATDASVARLWRFLGELDLVATVVAEDRAADEVLPWLLVDARAATETSRRDFLFARLLDVPVALEARAYATSGRTVIEVVDPMGLAGGRFALEADRDGATVKPTDEPAALTLPVRALSAAYLGGTRLRALHAAGWLDEHEPGAVERADALLAGAVTPWCNTWF